MDLQAWKNAIAEHGRAARERRSSMLSRTCSVKVVPSRRRSPTASSGEKHEESVPLTTLNPNDIILTIFNSGFRL